MRVGPLGMGDGAAAGRRLAACLLMAGLAASAAGAAFAAEPGVQGGGSPTVGNAPAPAVPPTGQDAQAQPSDASPVDKGNQTQSQAAAKPSPPQPATSQPATPQPASSQAAPSGAEPSEDASGDKADAVGRDLAAHPPQKPVAKGARLRTQKLQLDSLLDRSVRGSDNSEVGRVIDVMVSEDGRPAALVLDVGGFMGVGNRRVALAWDLFDLASGKPSDPVRLRLNGDQVRSAPAEEEKGEITIVTGAEGNAPAPAAPPASAPDVRVQLQAASPVPPGTPEGAESPAPPTPVASTPVAPPTVVAAPVVAPPAVPPPGTRAAGGASAGAKSAGATGEPAGPAGTAAPNTAPHGH